MTQYILTTGHTDYLPSDQAGRRFTVVDRKQSIHAAPLDLPQQCDICGKRRNQGNHQRCSRRRQQIRRGKQP
tara:strand:+ start:181 stop:396 length:216 start_codon:yes stop_codon:yes gene_type:complete